MRNNHRRWKTRPTHQPCPLSAFVSSGLLQCRCVLRLGGLSPYHRRREAPVTAGHPVGPGDQGVFSRALRPDRGEGQQVTNGDISFPANLCLPGHPYASPRLLAPSDAETPVCWPGSVPPLIQLGPSWVLKGCGASHCHQGAKQPQKPAKAASAVLRSGKQE